MYKRQPLRGGAALGVVASSSRNRWRPAAVLAGLAFNGASATLRFGVFHAGIESAKDPKYTVVPQKERIAVREAQAALSWSSNASTPGALRPPTSQSPQELA